MTNPNIKFFRCHSWPDTVIPQEGYIWFNTDNRTINLYKDGDWEKYTGKVNDVTYAEGRLTITRHDGEDTVIDLNSIGNIEDLSTRVSTLETNFNTLNGELTTEKGKIATLEKDMGDVKSEVEKLSDVTGKVGAYVVEQFRLHDESRTEIDGDFDERITTLETNYATLDGKVDGVQSTLQGEIDTLVGDKDEEGNFVDAGKSIRTIANEELAAQLLAGPDGVVDNFKTLQELAAWLEEHPESAAEMNQKINTNETNIATNTADIAELKAAWTWAEY